MDTAYKNCQSCGMPMKRDEQGGGTNADGSKSVKYCSHCFLAGEFTQPEISAVQMQALVKAKIQAVGFPGFIAGLFAKSVPGLERWAGK